MARPSYLPSMYLLHLVLATLASLNYAINSDDVTSSNQNAASSSSSSASSSGKSAKSLHRVRRQGGNFVRFGRGPSSFVRIGKMDPAAIDVDKNIESPEFMRPDRMTHMNRFIRIGRPNYNNPDDEIRDGSGSGSSKDWMYSKMKRPSAFVRIGKSLSDEEFPEIPSYDKRAPGFVRIGKDWKNKRPSGFVRIGKAFNNDDGDFDGFDEDDDEIFQNKRAPGFVRIGKSLQGGLNSANIDNNKRGSFVRIGKSLFNSDDDNSDDFDDVKRAPGFVRIGKSSNDFLNKRAPGFVRIGKSDVDFIPKRSPGFVRIGKDIDDEMPKRAPGFVRIGKAGLDDNEQEAQRYPGIGQDFDSALSKRAPGFVRIGKSGDNNDAFLHNKRAPGFVRIGKSSHGGHDFLNKRAPGFVRIGKSNFNDDDDDGDFNDHLFMSTRPERSVFADGFDSSVFEKDLVKKSSGFVRIGKSDLFNGVDEPMNDDDDDDHNKRQSGFVRIGKDHHNMFRAHTTDEANEEMDKKNAGFVRIGKQASSATGDNHRDSTLLSHSNSVSSERTGDAGGISSHFEKRSPIHVSRRGSAFVRIGKIPSAAFVPLTKDIGRLMDAAARGKTGYRRRSRNGQSSFVRIG